MVWGSVAVVLLSLGLWLGRMGSGRSEVSEVLVLERVRKMGQLTTVEQTFTGVLDYSSRRHAEGAWAAVPGADAVVGTLTRNSAVVSYQARVSASVDLSRARVERDATGWTVRIPGPVINPPLVRATTHTQSSGLLWRDLDVSYGAQDEAARRARMAAREAGIREQAWTNAVAQIQAILEPVAGGPVRVERE